VEVKPLPVPIEEDECDSDNLITNGCFERPNVSEWKIFKDGQVAGWEGNGIEIGKAKYYNENWPNGNKNQVAEMDGTGNIEFSQTLTLKEGKYNLALDCAARNGRPVETSQLEIVWNGKVIQTVTPKNYKIERVALNLDAENGENTLTLRGAGTSD